VTFITATYRARREILSNLRRIRDAALVTAKSEMVA
jgi:hypothetical protein